MDIMEIPFGAKDSELCGWEYTIPEGMEAVIENGKVIVRKTESEDEKIRKQLVDIVAFIPEANFKSASREDCRAYLERQKEQKPAKWSNEDKEMLDAMIDMVSNSLYEPLCPRKEMLAWLKALRDRFALSHWRPSEYTLSLVKKVADGEMLTGVEQMAMGTLYEHLKKL